MTTEPLQGNPDLIPDGYIADFISGLSVRATSEEVDAVQVFARRLVEDLGYSREQIQTRPQHRVRVRPSDLPASYPVDIAVFAGESRDEDDLVLVVECKKRTRRSGLRQLEIYLSMNQAHVGAWFNGEEHLYLRKHYLTGGEIAFEEIPALPRAGQRVEDIGKYRREDLAPTHALRPIFRDLRNHLAGNLTGITRDETLAQQIINVLFCKIYDEMDKGPSEYVAFRAGVGEDAAIVHDRILNLFAAVKSRYGEVFTDADSIEIDDKNLVYVVGELQNYSITESARDAIGDAFEVFIGPALRGSEGQFFTPRNVVHMVIDMLDPEPGDLVIDPACGSGGFLIAALEYIWAKVEREAARRGWSTERMAEERRYVASQYIRGIEKDRFLAKVTKAYMAIVGDGRSGVFCENSLLPPASWDPQMAREIPLATFDVVVTNPPFGTRIPVKGREILRQFDLAHKFTPKKDNPREFEAGSLLDAQSPQLLFIERCLDLLKEGGRLGIILPESIFGMPTYAHVVDYLRSRYTIVGIVSMPEDLFQPHTHAKTCVVLIEKRSPRNDDEIFMSIVEWCGHDSRGNPTIKRDEDGKEVLLDDVPRVASEFRSLMGKVWK